MTAIPGLYVRRRFLPDDLLDQLAACLAVADGDPAAVQAAPGGTLAVAQDVRRVWEVALPDDLHDRMVECLRSAHAGIEAHFGGRLEPCEAVAALRYPPGSFYRTHRDRSAQPDRYGLHRRAVSIVVFVNTAAPPAAAFGGGTLRLHEVAAAPAGVYDITPVAGTLVAFPSSQLHEVTPIEWGTRLSVVTWLLGDQRPAAT